MQRRRKPGEKKRKKSKLLTLPAFPDPRIPGEPSLLIAFIESCEGEIPTDEAIREFQEEWCSHPRSKFSLAATQGSPSDEDFTYIRVCGECGQLQTKKGKPPSWLK